MQTEISSETHGKQSEQKHEMGHDAGCFCLALLMISNSSDECNAYVGVWVFRLSHGAGCSGSHMAQGVRALTWRGGCRALTWRGVFGLSHGAECSGSHMAC